MALGQFKGLVKGLVPERFHLGMDAAWSRITWPLYLGDRVCCPICRGRFREFLPLHHRPGVRCPRCRSFDRHRLLWLFLRKRTHFFQRNLRVLHLAPEVILQRRFLALPNIDYVSADLYSPIADVQADICQMPFEDGSFDVVFCYHMLEHIPDDRAAMREIHRVLSPKGWSIIQVPLSDNARTIEDPTLKDPKERERLFGQHDHVRLYGKDYPTRLEEAGFRVTVDDFVRRIPVKVIQRYGLTPTEDIHVCRHRTE